MRKLFIFVAAFVVSLAILLTACKKDDPKPDNTGNDNNQEIPGGGGGGEITPNQEYPETAVVLPQAVTDIDGNTYDAVQIGNQVWMAENLRTTKYANGTTIPLGGSTYTNEPHRFAPGPNQSSGENMANVCRYGYLYNWSAVMQGANSSESNPSHVQGICPTGWHVPSDAEWTELINYLKTQSSYTASGNTDHLAKALAATWGWNSTNETDAPGNNPSTNNVTGFSALPAGYYYGPDDIFSDNNGFGIGAEFWSATEHNVDDARYFNIYYEYAYVSVNSYEKSSGFSVRCVRD